MIRRMLSGDLRARVESGLLRCGAPASGWIDALPVSGEVLVGARPEDSRVTRGAAGPGASPGRVYVVEPTGPETYVTVEVEGGDRVVCRAEAGFRARPGDGVAVALDPERLHFLDATTRRRRGALISRGRPSVACGRDPRGKDRIDGCGESS